MKSDIDLLILDYIDGSITKEQEVELFEWVEASEQNVEYFSQSVAYLELTYTSGKSEKYNAEKGWRRLSDKLNKRSILIQMWQSYGKIAAVFLLAFFMGYGVFRYELIPVSEQLSQDYIKTEVPLGSKSVVTLPDGSRVWINAGSAMSYPVKFDENHRTVKLEGEAFFDVVTNKNRPFFVETEGIKVKATGTQFNVRAYADEAFVETILVKGEIAVNRTNMTDDELVMHPNQKLTLYKDQAKEQHAAHHDVEKEEAEAPKAPQNIPLKVKKVELTSNVRTDIYTSWKDREWIIFKEKFGMLAQKLEKRYDVKIKIKDRQVCDFAYSGTLKDENLKDVLDVLSITSPIKYEFDSKNVTIWYNPQFYDSN